jgi:small subunit ribosomal protein S2
MKAEVKNKGDLSMRIVSMKELLESGVHFGHRTRRWHPRMAPYIFTERNGIHIIDLEKTLRGLEKAYALVRDIVSEGGSVLFVGTKRQAQDTIQLEAERCGMPWITHRWLGGTMTNWDTIRQRVNELNRLERQRDQGEFDLLQKKEALNQTRKIDRLDMLFGGIRDMGGVPDIVFVVDISREITAVHEANLLNVPVVAMVDTNCDPRNVDFIIPSNDDAIRAIKLIVSKIANAVIEGQSMRKDEVEEIPAVPDVAYEKTAELSDDELLGESTLAKLEAQKTVAAKVVEETVAAEAVEETVVAEAVEETVAAEAVEDAIETEAVEEKVAAEAVGETVAVEAVEDAIETEAVEETVAAEVVEDVIETEAAELDETVEAAEQTSKEETTEEEA